MPLAEIGGAAAAGHMAQSIFGYNRAGFLFDRGQQVQRNLQALSYKVQKINLYRQDVRDVSGLTLSRTNQYHFVTALELAICATMIGPGKIVHGIAPEWVLWHQRVTLCTAFAFLLASMWLSMRASLIAASYNARLQLRYLRPPLPDCEQLNKLVASAGEFENAENSGSVMRVPFMSDGHSGHSGGSASSANPEVTQPTRRRTSPSQVSFAEPRPPLEIPEDPASSNDLLSQLDCEVSPRHLQHSERLQQKWSACDAYSQLCMSAGTYFLLLSFMYYSIAYDLYNHKSIGTAAGASLVLFAVLLALLYMDHVARWWEVLFAAFCMSGGPMLIIIRAFVSEGKAWDHFLDLVGDLLSVALSLWLLKQGLPSSGEEVLPNRFRPAHYLNVYGLSMDNLQRDFCTAKTPDAELGEGPARLATMPTMRPRDTWNLHRNMTFRDAEERVASRMPARTYMGICFVSVLLRLSNLGIGFHGGSYELIDFNDPVDRWAISDLKENEGIDIPVLKASAFMPAHHGHGWFLPRQPAFFRPDILSCSKTHGGQNVLIASNGFLVYRLFHEAEHPEDSEEVAAPIPLKCPVLRHEDMLDGGCDSRGNCFAIVGEGDRLWRCSSEVAPVAGAVANASSSAPTRSAAGAGLGTDAWPVAKVASNSGFVQWAPVSSDLRRVFAAPRSGPILELRLVEEVGEDTPNLLEPVAELPMPDRLQGAQWLDLQVVNGTRLVASAVMHTERLFFVWDIDTGTYLAVWSVPKELEGSDGGGNLCIKDDQLYGGVVHLRHSSSLKLRRWNLPQMGGA